MVKEEWNEIIAAKLKAGVSIEDLKHSYAEGISLEPNVMASDIAGYTHSLTVNESWINMASIREGSTVEKNTSALQALQYGANGLSIAITKEDNVESLLSGIMTEYLDVRLDGRTLTDDELQQKKASLNSSDFPNIRWIHASECKEIQIERSNRIASIKSALHKVDASASVDITVDIGKQLLFEIASLRAIRALLDENQVQSCNIICTYEVEGNNDLGDYNLIEKTYKVMSGILGGANAILTPFDGTEEARLTLNIHNVLDLESGMKSVLDPLAGSYYIEKLTGEIIRQVKSEA